MAISKYFTLDEVTHTNQNIPNVPNELQLKNVGYLCTSVLDKIREHFDAPVTCSSVFRSKAVNEAVGGAPTSQHCANNGAAADITSVKGYSLIDVLKWVKDNLDFDQMIAENVAEVSRPESMKWLHISKKMKDNRKEILIMYKGKYYKY